MRKFIFALMGTFVFIILSFTIYQEYTLNFGKEVLLKTVPVDPRDLLMGDYVILNYDIAQLNNSKYNFPNNKTIYVKLKTDENNIATIENILEKAPKYSLYLKGKTGGCNTTIPMLKSGKCINFGIESFYVKENTGTELENNLRNGALVRVKIDNWGNGKVVGFVR